MANIYWGTGCPKEIQKLFKKLGVAEQEEINNFWGMDRVWRSQFRKTRYWEKRAYRIMFAIYDSEEEE